MTYNHQPATLRQGAEEGSRKVSQNETFIAYQPSRARFAIHSNRQSTEYIKVVVKKKMKQSPNDINETKKLKKKEKELHKKMIVTQEYEGTLTE